MGGRGKGEKVRQERTAAAVMERARQTPHGARPNREGVPPLLLALPLAETGNKGGRVLARCAKPSGRSLEPRSNARPRGMAVLRYVAVAANFGSRRRFPADRIRLTGPAADFSTT
jgi:hypothetical protein